MTQRTSYLITGGAGFIGSHVADVHSSHRLAGMGFSGRAIALTHYAAQTACCGVAIWLLHAPRDLVMPVVLGVGLVALLLLVALVSVKSGATGCDRLGRRTRPAPKPSRMAPVESRRSPTDQR